MTNSPCSLFKTATGSSLKRLCNYSACSDGKRRSLGRARKTIGDGPEPSTQIALKA